MFASPTTARKPLNEQSLRSPGKCPFPCPLCKQLRDLSKALSEGGWFNPPPKLKNTPRSQRGSPMFLLRAESYYNQNKCFSSANKFPITWKEVPTKNETGFAAVSKKEAKPESGFSMESTLLRERLLRQDLLQNLQRLHNGIHV